MRRGACSPSTLPSISGQWLVLAGPQSCKPTLLASRCVSRCAIAKPPLPSSCVNTIITCLKHKIGTPIILWSVERGENILPVKRRHRVDGAQLAPGRNNIVALLAVAFDIDPLVLVSVFHHHHQPSPAFGQVISSHSFAALFE